MQVGKAFYKSLLVDSEFQGADYGESCFGLVCFDVLWPALDRP